MARQQKKPFTRPAAAPTTLDQARDELFSHILRCGVTEAEPEQQKEWLDDTMQYLTERYPDLEEDQMVQVRTLGERFCRPVARKPEVAGSNAE
ncbi:MAG: hypothetical protein ACYC2K_02255 [Gemmatimonadales bacterium]